jgi:hypothetical protein
MLVDFVSDVCAPACLHEGDVLCCADCLLQD